MTSLKPHLTYANVVATLALVLAVAGGSTAIAISTKVKKNSVGTKQLKNGAVTAAKLGKEAVTSDKLVDGSVTASKLVPVKVVATAGGLANCSVGEKLLGGGGVELGGPLSETFPTVTPGATPLQWVAGGPGTSTTTYAMCLQATP
jgi:hypothetical protein